MKKYWIFLISIIILLQSISAAVNIDSLLVVWNNPKELDTNRLNSIQKVAWDGFLFNKPDSAIYYAQLQYDFATQKGLKKYVAEALNTQGVAYAILGDYTSSLDRLYSSLNIREQINDKSGISVCLNNIGNIYRDQGLFDKAIESFSKSLKIKEELDDKKGISNVLKNIGNIYENKQNNEKALEYYEKGLKISEEINDKKGIAGFLNNIGIILHNNGNPLKALEYYDKSLIIKKELGDKKGIGSTLNNIGNIYIDLKDNEKAIDYFTQAFIIRQEVGDKKGLAITYDNLSRTYLNLNNFSKALDFAQKSYTSAQEVGSLTDLKNAAFSLYKSYKGVKQFQKAMEMLELGTMYKDSILNEEGERALIQQEYKYIYEKQVLQDSIENAEIEKINKIESDKKESIREAEKKQESTLRYALIIGLSIVIVFSVFIFNRFRITRRQRDLINKQKVEVENQREIAERLKIEADNQRHLVEEKNQEITDSIHYAQRIQEAILPSRASLVENLQDGFVLFKPKDVVSGDFYWLETYAKASVSDGDNIPIPPPMEGAKGAVSGGRGVVYFAAADCTGHGVPGAMVSVICSNALSKALLEEHITETGKILDKTRELVIQRFAKSDEMVKDGMDVSLCKIQNNRLEWSGANNPLWIVTKNEEGIPELIEVKPDKQPIGNYAEPTPFTTHCFELAKGTTIYIFTDGYADQFGGPKGKKFMYKPFKELILSIQDKSMDEQKIALEIAFQNWRGNNEQIDDVCIIGVRV